MEKVATIKEIARQLNISASSVSRALHDHPGIGVHTKMRVQKLAQELNVEVWKRRNIKMPPDCSFSMAHAAHI